RAVTEASRRARCDRLPVGRALAAGGCPGETARTAHRTWRRGSRLAGCRPRAAEGDAGDRLPRQWLAHLTGGVHRCVQSGTKRNRVCRGPKCLDRIPPDRGPVRSTPALIIELTDRKVVVIAVIGTPT